MSLNSIFQELLQSNVKFEELNISAETLKEIEFLKNKYNKSELTEQSAEVLTFLQQNYEVGTLFTCKEIGDKMSISARSVSGFLQKMVRLNYIEKVVGKPTEYRLTSEGKKATIDNK